MSSLTLTLTPSQAVTVVPWLLEDDPEPDGFSRMLANAWCWHNGANTPRQTKDPEGFYLAVETSESSRLVSVTANQMRWRYALAQTNHAGLNAGPKVLFLHPMLCPECNSGEFLFERVIRPVRWGEEEDTSHVYDRTHPKDSDPVEIVLRCTNDASFGQPCWEGTRHDLITDYEDIERIEA